MYFYCVITTKNKLKGLSMNRRTLIIASSILLFSLVLVTISIFSINKLKKNDMTGQLVFAETSTQGAHLDKIILTTSQSQTTLHLSDGFWRVVEGNNYYANMSLTNSLFMAMNKSRYFISIDTQGRDVGDYFLHSPQTGTSKSGVLIQTFANNKMLNEIILGGTTPDNIYSYIRIPNQNEIWMINNDFTIPQKTYSWFQQPLLNYASNQIRMYRTEIGQQAIEYKRRRPSDDFSDKNNRIEPLNILSEAFGYMTFSDVIPLQKFDKNKYSHHRQLEITLFNGLVTTMDIYTDKAEKDYWCSIKISANRLPTSGVNDYIKNNEFLYNGWMFQLAPEIGNILYKTLETKK